MPVDTSSIRDLLQDAIDETGAKLRASAEEVAAYAAARASHLSAISNEPGFEMAVRAERDNVLVRAGIAAADQADAADSRIVGIIQAVLTIGAKALLA